MSLRDIAYREDYRSGYDDIVEDFFRPSLREARDYWRAVGYFSSSAFEALGSTLGDFIKRDGRIRLVTSVEFSEDDLKAIETGTAKQEICARRVERIIDEEFADGAADGALRLIRLLELDRLEIRIAVPKTGTGIYHEKIGIFLNGSDFVAFTGSSNESLNAFANNRECIDVYTSWNSAVRASRKREHFEILWMRRDEGVEVYGFPEAARKKLLRISERSRQSPQPLLQDPKWRHQDEALEAFLRAERGVVDMATGTGKTRTALMILRELFERRDIDTVIVCASGNDLLDQWNRELLRARETVDREIRVWRHYGGNKDLQEFTLDPANSVLVVSRDPAARVPAASALRHLNADQGARTLLIHDEVHGLGSPDCRKRLDGLSDRIRFRLGLSATPQREYDEEGNTFIDRHIGPVIMSFGLEDAIERGVLAPFDYHPLPFALTDADRERRTKLFSRRKACEEAGQPMSKTDFLIALANIYKNSEAKLPAFSEFIAGRQDLLRRCIVFVPTMEYGNAVLDIIHKYRSDFHTYFSGERPDTLARFARGELECLITCHRLSEGIDIRSLNSVILFSSDRARLEAIQRLGRCLRTDPDDPRKVASVVDFIREGREGEEFNADEERQDWLLNLSRMRPAGWA